MHPGQEVDGVGFEKEHLCDPQCLGWIMSADGCRHDPSLSNPSLGWIGQTERDREMFLYLKVCFFY